MENRGIFPTERTGKGGKAKGRVKGKKEKDLETEEEKNSSSHNFDNGVFEQGGGVTIISVVENRAREICISKMTTGQAYKLEVYIFSDNHAYTESISIINSLDPSEILLHDGCKNRILSQKIEFITSTNTDSCRVIYISRQYFDQDLGAELLKKIVIGEIDSDLVAKYTVLAGTFCLLRYIENCSGVNFQPYSMRLQYESGSVGRMAIDRSTINHLELVSNARTGSSKYSLFGTINNTKTVVGARLLKACLLRPSTDVTTINTRLDCVELLLKNNRSFGQIIEILGKFPDLDRVLTGLTTVPKQINAKTASVSIDTLICLKDTLKVTQLLTDTLHLLDGAGPRNVLVEAMIRNLEHPSFAVAKAAIDDLLVDSAKSSRNAHEMKHQECFAVKPGISGLLDVSRKTFLTAVEGIYSKAEQLAHQYETSVRVSHSAARGYFLLIPASLRPLPDEVVQAVLNKSSVSCTTDEIMSLSDRAEEGIGNALMLTNDLVARLIGALRCEIDALFSLADTVALLDMMCSFADLAALSPHPYTRPTVTAGGPMVVAGGRHPVVASLGAQRFNATFVENDTHLTPLSNLHVITGANGSGKTVYIKQVAIICIMAQIGCFVPARQATLPIRDRLLSRIGNKDDLEHNLSTFLSEMRDAAYILNNMTPRSLIIVDELGRGTSNIDGISLAFSLCEAMLDSGAYVLFVTHYPQLCSVPSMYTNAKNVHMVTALGGPVAGLQYKHKLGDGPCDMSSGYGIFMAEAAGFPKEMLVDARAIQHVVRLAFPSLLPCQQVDRSINYMTCMLKKLEELQRSNLSHRALAAYLHSLRSRIDPAASSRIVDYLRLLDSEDGGPVGGACGVETTAAAAVAVQQDGDDDGADTSSRSKQLEQDREAAAALLGLCDDGDIGSEKENCGQDNKRRKMRKIHTLSERPARTLSG